jgi:hypothetical protein
LIKLLTFCVNVIFITKYKVIYLFYSFKNHLLNSWNQFYEINDNKIIGLILFGKFLYQYFLIIAFVGQIFKTFSLEK